MEVPQKGLRPLQASMFSRPLELIVGFIEGPQKDRRLLFLFPDQPDTTIKCQEGIHLCPPRPRGNLVNMSLQSFSCPPMRRNTPL